jgi:outer membrane protein TolC
MKLFSISSLFIFSALLSAQAFCQTAGDDSLTLEQAIGMVVSENPAIQELISNSVASGAHVDETKSEYYPTVGIEGSYTRLEPASAFSLPEFGTLDLYPLNNYDAHLGVHQTVYDFDRTKESVELSQSQVTTTSDKIDQMKRDLAFQTSRTFYAIIFSHRSIEVQNEQIDELQQHLETVKKRLASGTATDFDVLTIQVRISAARSVLVDLEDQLRKEEITLRRLTGIPATQEIRLHGDFSAEPVSLNVDSLSGAAVENSLDVKGANDAILTKQIQIRSASLTDKPSLAFNANYGFKNGFFPDIDVLRGNFVAGLELNVPLFDGYRTRGLEEEANANLDAAEHHKADVESRVRSEVAQAIADLRATGERLQTAELDVQQAKTALDLAKVKFDAGVITNLDLLDAQTALQEAQLSRLQSLYNYVVSRIELRRAVGEKIW